MKTAFLTAATGTASPKDTLLLRLKPNVPPRPSSCSRVRLSLQLGRPLLHIALCHGGLCAFGTVRCVLVVWVPFLHRTYFARTKNKGKGDSTGVVDASTTPVTITLPSKNVARAFVSHQCN